ncbi:hypothetical protein K488DRAFT_55337 [Vararia minispora EC-137]|uniref:Uncharacterized protein n=1 Tax=Vararia minispora EC-137 TaxID=1314806 RepID=A0ACB8QDL7_9AGAM|nr:hypothetical protein K488DRAFT_55337 [Vararia minispora EC-137]
MFANTFAAALFAIPLLASGVVAGCTRTYQVKEGDWCDTISASNNASTYQLATVNSGINDLCGNLAVGWVLCLGLTSTDCTSTYVVQSGDSVDNIATAHGLNTTVLLANNPQLVADSSNLYIGEVRRLARALCVPDLASHR